MAVLGHGGKLQLKREAPEAVVLWPGIINETANGIPLREPAFWSGDYVNVRCPDGLPIGIGGPGTGPSNPDAYAMYFGGSAFLGVNKAHITAESDSYFTDDDSDAFYMTKQTSGYTESADLYVYRDKLDRLCFYPTRAQALNGRPSERLPQYVVDSAGMIVSAKGTPEYESAVAACMPAIADYTIGSDNSEVQLKIACPTFNPEGRNYVNAGSEGSLWTIQAQLKDWTLNLDAPEVDTTAVGERFGDSVKSLVTGGGTMDFILEREYLDDGRFDPTALMRLVLLTDKGCNADAEFWMINNRADNYNFRLPGDLYYESQLMVTSLAINTRADDIIAGSLNFVTVGEIALRMGTN